LAIPLVRRRFTVARGHLREILGRYAGRPPEHLKFRYGGSGKPALVVPDSPRFSVSHTEDLAVFALHRTLELGVDVERLRTIPNGERLAKRFFSPSEHGALLRVPPERRDFAFLTCWTRKEACAKAVGEPLIPMLKRFEVPVEPGESARVVLLDGDPVAAARWSLADLAPASGHVGALAVEGPVSRVLLFAYPGA
jgi:4'-phosphopantetheinyl transferase